MICFASKPDTIAQPETKCWTAVNPVCPLCWSITAYNPSAGRGPRSKSLHPSKHLCPSSNVTQWMWCFSKPSRVVFVWILWDLCWMSGSKILGPFGDLRMQDDADVTMSKLIPEDSRSGSLEQFLNYLLGIWRSGTHKKSTSTGSLYVHHQILKSTTRYHDISCVYVW